LNDKSIEFINYGSKVLINSIIICLTLVILAQCILLTEPYSAKISLLDKIEGKRINNDIIYPTGNINLEVNYITFKVLNPYIGSLANGKIYVNNKLIGDFSSLQNTINVELGDIINLVFIDYSLDIIVKFVASKGIKIEKDIVKIDQGTDFIMEVKEAN